MATISINTEGDEAASLPLPAAPSRRRHVRRNVPARDDPPPIESTTATTTPTTETVRYSTRDLANIAEWRPWPVNLLYPNGGNSPSLRLIHNLCSSSWIDALTTAASSWSAGTTSINLLIENGGCQPSINGNLNYIDNAIHVVYGTCGPNCCGKADVEYDYFETPRGDVEITRYAVLVRFDPSCFPDRGGNGNGGGAADVRGKQYIACHELGHALGLGHNYDSMSCLNSMSGDNYMPGWDDLNLLNYELYPVQMAEDLLELKEDGGGSAQSGGGDEDYNADTIAPGQDSNVLNILESGDCTKKECGRCQGDCDDDRDCRDGLKCFLRSEYTAVPGCSGDGVRHKDYCYDPAAPLRISDDDGYDGAIGRDSDGSSRESDVGDKPLFPPMDFLTNGGKDGRLTSAISIAIISLAALLVSAVLLFAFVFVRRRKRRYREFYSNRRIESKPTADIGDEEEEEDAENDGIGCEEDFLENA